MKNKGYTLVELAIVFAIGGVMMASTGSIMVNYTNQAKLSETKMRLERINIALRQYQKNNGKYPCPASQSAGVNDTTFGYEVSTTCTAGAIAGTTRAAGRGGAMVRVGALPTRSLLLPDEDMFDGWGNRLVYGVTENLATFGSFVQNGGAIYMIDSNGNASQLPSGTAHYAVISLGPDGVGAYGLNGIQAIACPAAGFIQAENCNGDATFRTNLKASVAAGTAAYDDLVSYGAQFDTAVVTATLPQGAIAAFDLDSCPSGWTAVPQAVGRAPLGTGLYTENIPAAGTRPGWNFSYNYPLFEQGGYAYWALNEAEMLSHTHAQRDQLTSVSAAGGAGNVLGGTTSGTYFTEYEGGNAAHENRQPWLALLYCQKD